MSGRVSPGWYPDYDAPPGHQRFWDGERWTERRAAVPTRGSARQIAGWVGAGVVAVVILVVAALLLTDDPPPASSPRSADPTTHTESASPTGTDEVEGVLDDAVLQLATGELVRLVGVTADGDCATSTLAGLVEGRRVTMVTPGADQDSDGRLLRYVDRDGVDVGLRLIQRGVATASDEPSPRRAIYRRVDERNPDVC